jgi:hypothetical protein
MVRCKQEYQIYYEEEQSKFLGLSWTWR